MKIRNLNTGAEYSSPTLEYDSERNEYSDMRCWVWYNMWSRIPLTFGLTDDWEEVKESTSIEEAAKDYCNKNIPSLPDMHLTISTAFESGAEWAKNHITDGGKTMWHDLRKNPKDLPQRYKNVLVANYKETFYGYYDSKYFMVNNYGSVDFPLAWMELPQFNKEEQK